jgi:diguanylate cyclase (GGDEF)-like protein
MSLPPGTPARRSARPSPARALGWILLLLLSVPRPARAQRGAPAVPERARTLIRLASQEQSSAPAEAVAHADEALRLLGRAGDDSAVISARAAAHGLAAAAYTTLGRYDSAATAAEAGRALATRVGDREGLAQALTALGALAQRRGDPVRAVAHLSDALEHQRAIGADSAVAATLTLLGFIHTSDYAEYDRALALQLESLRIRERLQNDRPGLATTVNSLGVIYARLRQHDRAMELYRRALALHREAGAGGRAASTLTNMGDLLLEQGDPAGALRHHRESLALRRVVGDRWALSLAHRNIALTYLALGRLPDARAELDTAMRLGAGTGNQGLTVRNLLALASLERARGRPAAAERAAQQALDAANGMRARELVRRSWEALASAQEADGRPGDALASYRRFKAQSDSVFDEATARRVSSLEERYAAARQAREIERLTTAQAISALQASQRATQRNAVAGGALLLAAVGAAAYRRRVRDARHAQALSLTDPLTGARNRRYVREVVAREMAGVRTLRLGRRSRVVPPTQDTTFLLLDVDHFKQVNDGFGHVAGDRLLSDLARLLQTACGPEGVVVRWGGEEFLVVSHGPAEQAATLAERLRAAVAAHVTTLDDGRTLTVTCSIGFAVAPRPSDGPAWGWESVVALADHGTYAAKRLGRDAWVGYVPGERQPPAAVATLSPELIAGWVADGQLRREASNGAPDVAHVRVA